MTEETKEIRTTLGNLSDEELDLYPAWEATGELEDGDKILVPARMTTDGLVAGNVGEVWCRSVCTFANGDVHRACAMYRADGAVGPLAWTISKGGEELLLLVPPTPPTLLHIDGPIPFAKAFALPLGEVFPLEVRSVVRFAVPPHERSVEICELGVLKRV